MTNREANNLKEKCYDKNLNGGRGIFVGGGSMTVSGVCAVPLRIRELHFSYKFFILALFVLNLPICRPTILGDI